MNRWLLTGLALILAACGVGVELGDISLPDEIDADFDLDSVLEEVRDCDRLSETFVEVVSQAARDLDERAEDGSLPQAELAEKVEAVATSRFFAIAERLGCAKLEMELRTVDRLRDLAPDSEEGNQLVDEVIRRVEDEGT